MAYNLSAFAGAGAQFFDDNGSPLAGGKLYVYAAGTTTPATTWTTQSGLVANSNPIILDAAGRTPDEIWVAGGVLYKFIVKDSTDVLIGTYDNIPGIDDPTVFNDLITVTGTNTLLGTSTPPITGYTTGATYSFVVQNTNTGAVTISIDGLGAKDVTYAGATPLIAGQLVANSIAVIEYDGTRFQLMQSSASIATVASLNVTNDATIGGKLTVAGNNISAVNSLGFRNRIINGDMRIDQRNAGTSVSISSNVYTLDRWAADQSGLNAYTVQQSNTVPTGFTKSLLITTGTGATVDPGDYAMLRQSIEGFNTADLGLGTATAVPFILSFWVRSSITGTFGVSFRNNAATATYCATYTISAANTWEYKTVAVPAITSGTWTTDNTTGIAVFWDLGVGSTYSGTANQLNTGANYFGVAGTTKLAANTGATFYITGVQLEAGTVATPFERRPYGTELALCERYYQRWTAGAPIGRGIVASGGGNVDQTVLVFRTKMRANPTLGSFGLFHADGSTTSTASINFSQTRPESALFNTTLTGGALTAFRTASSLLDTSTGWFEAAAEL